MVKLSMHIDSPEVTTQYWCRVVIWPFAWHVYIIVVYSIFSYFYIYKLPLYLHVADFKCCELNLRKQE